MAIMDKCLFLSFLCNGDSHVPAITASTSNFSSPTGCSLAANRASLCPSCWRKLSRNLFPGPGVDCFAILSLLNDAGTALDPLALTESEVTSIPGFVSFEGLDMLQVYTQNVYSGLSIPHKEDGSRLLYIHQPNHSYL
jgi:hypothetical protein